MRTTLAALAMFGVTAPGALLGAQESPDEPPATAAPAPPRVGDAAPETQGEAPVSEPPAPAAVTYQGPLAPAPMPAPAPTPAAAPLPDAPPETGVLLQARLATNQRIVDETLTSAPIASSFVVAYHTGPVSFGGLLGFTRGAVSNDDGGDEANFTSSIWQIAPVLFFDVWRSADARTRMNLVASVGYGKLSEEFERCDTYYDECSTTEASATIVPLTLAVGADHFIGRHFAIGLEGGLQAMFLSEMEVEDEDTDASADTQWVYGMLRLSVLAGD